MSYSHITEYLFHARPWQHTCVRQLYKKLSYSGFQVDAQCWNIAIASMRYIPYMARTIWFQFKLSWWRHQMETSFALLDIYPGNSTVPSEFPAQRPVTRIFVIFFDQRLNKRLSKQSWCWWFETTSRPLWRHRNAAWHDNVLHRADLSIFGIWVFYVQYIPTLQASQTAQLYINMDILMEGNLMTSWIKKSIYDIFCLLNACPSTTDFSGTNGHW